MTKIKDFISNKKDLMRNQHGVQIKIDPNTLPDMNCIKCGSLEFITVTRIKKLSRTISPTGQEGNVNINMLKCINCAWLFNPAEWEKHQEGLEKEKTVSDNDKEINVTLNETIKFNDKVKEKNNKKMCRNCGEFYNQNEVHKCKG